MRYDYTTLQLHRCLKADVQKYAKYKAKQAKLAGTAVKKSVKSVKTATKKVAVKTSVIRTASKPASSQKKK